LTLLKRNIGGNNTDINHSSTYYLYIPIHGTLLLIWQSVHFYKTTTLNTCADVAFFSEIALYTWCQPCTKNVMDINLSRGYCFYVNHHSTEIKYILSWWNKSCKSST